MNVHRPYALKPCVYLTQVLPDQVRLVVRGNAEASIEGACGSILDLLEALDGRLPLSQVAKIVTERWPEVRCEDVYETVSMLFHHGFLAEGPQQPGTDADRYSRQISFLSLWSSDPHDWHRQQTRLARAEVAVVGLGGVGAPAADLLVRAGVGAVRCIDGDVIEPSNLTRQTLYGEADVGKCKADVAKRYLKGIRSDVDVTAVSLAIKEPDDLRGAIKGVSLVLVSADMPRGEMPFLANLACMKAGVPCLFSGYSGDVGMVGPLVVPGQPPCLQCGTPRAQQHRLAPTLAAAAREQVARLDHRFRPPSIGPICLMVASMAALEVLRWLSGYGQPLSLATMLVLDTQTNQWERIPLGRIDQNVACPCRQGPSEGG